jgi:hypothetical protein
MQHDIKCWPEHFEPVSRGVKTVELRLNDRNYQVGDVLHLREWEPMEYAYTGRSLHVIITHTVSGVGWLTPGYVALGIRIATRRRTRGGR